MLGTRKCWRLKVNKPPLGEFTPPPNSGVLVVEDEEDIQNLMCLHLQREGYWVDSAQTGKQAYSKLSDNMYQLIILDWMIPGINGLDLLRWIRGPDHPHRNTPVLFATAKFHPADIVTALEAGADDYITKPFDFLVFKARVKNLIRRLKMVRILSDNDKTKNTLLKLGELKLNTESHQVFIKNKEIELTFSEFRLLEVLLKNQGKVLSRKQMVGFIQGTDINVTGRTVDTHISILRKKIKEYGPFIETVRGVGYRISFNY